MSEPRRIAVLFSGGLDSSVLVADLSSQGAEVYPIYVQFGLAWEAQEQAAMQAYLTAVANPRLHPLTTLQTPVAPMYGEHWSLSGRAPGYDEPDEAVFLPGRNILLIGAVSVWCSTHGVAEIAIGSLGENPFPDASPQFFADFGRVLSTGLGHQVQVIAPYRGLHKHDIIKRHAHLPLELSLTCMAPRGGVHCGACNKCNERQTAFREAGVPDKTRYGA